MLLAVLRILIRNVGNNTPPRLSKITNEEKCHNNSPFFVLNYFLRKNGVNLIASPRPSLMNQKHWGPKVKPV